MLLIFFAPTKFGEPLGFRRRLTGVKYFCVGVLLPLLFFGYLHYLQTGSILYHVANYDGNSGASDAASLFSLNIFNFRRIFDFFLGIHWGVFWLMPLYLIEAGYLWTKRINLWKVLVSQMPFRIGATLLCILFGMKLWVMANYPTNSMSYGNRYIFPEYYAIHFLFLFVLGQWGIQKKKLLLLGIASLTVFFASANLLNFESNGDTLTLTVQRSGLEGIYDPRFAEIETLVAPRYAYHSFANTLRGGAFKNLVAAPVVAYPLLALRETFLGKSSAYSMALSYYLSPKRKVEHLSDLKVLLQYHLIIFLGSLCLVLFLGLCRRRQVDSV